MAVQSTYSERMPKATPGLTVGKGKNATGICETAAGIGFGLAVSQGTADKGVVLGGSLATFRGISIRDITVVNASDPDKYAQYNNVGVREAGQVWVSPAAAVSAMDPVHFDASTGRLSNTGGQGPILGARWVTSADQDGLALVDLPAYHQ